MDDPIDKAAFAHPAMVRDLIRLLPRSLTGDLDLRTLRRLPSANVGKGAKQRLADMPLSVGFRPSAGRPEGSRLLLVLEFQSAVDAHMALRLDAYAALARQDLLRRGLPGPGRGASRSALRGGVHGPRPLDRAPEPGWVDGGGAWGTGAHAAGVALLGA